MKDLLSAPIDTLVQDFDEIKHLLAEIQPQLLIVLQIKLWPVEHLPFFRAQVEKAHRRIEARCSQASLKAILPKSANWLMIRRWLWMPRLIPLQAPKDLIFWRRSWKISKNESEQPRGLSRTRKTLWPAQSRKQRTWPPS
jgi:hypothetical protein